MATVGVQPGIRSYILTHLLESLRRTPADDAPFSHFYVENIFPDDIYEQLLDLLPDPSLYKPLSINKHYNQTGNSTRDVLPLTEAERLKPLPPEQRDFWQAICAALTAPEVKARWCSKNWRPICRRVSACGGRKWIGSSPIANHRCSAIWTATRSSLIPTAGPRSSRCSFMPRDRSQLELGTALYRRRLHSLKGIYSWQGRFEKVKQFPFQPNSGYAFRRFQRLEQEELARPRSSPRRQRSAQYADESLFRPRTTGRIRRIPVVSRRGYCDPPVPPRPCPSALWTCQL